MATIYGNNGANDLYGRLNENNDIFALGGDNDVFGGLYADYVEAGSGWDYVDGEDGNDTIYGDQGDDLLYGGAGTDRLSGDEDDDELHGGDGNDELDLESYARPGDHDLAYGGAGNDLIYGAVLDATADVFGDDGEDRLLAGRGAEYFNGGAGFDQVSYADSGARVVVNLATGRGLYGSAEGDRLVSVEDIEGSAYDDSLAGTSGANELLGRAGLDRLAGGAGNDFLDGGSGNDLVTGGAGADQLFGGTGADRFILGSALDTGVSISTRDTIGDFRRSEGDRIDLSAIDANRSASGNQAFALIGTAAFSGAAGELRYATTTGYAVVYGDTNGDRVADFSFRTNGVAAFAASDFLL